MMALKRKKMREIAAPIALLLLALAFTMATMGCPTDGGGSEDLSTAVEGKWVSGGDKASFKGNSFTMTVSVDGTDLDVRGIFVLSRPDRITFTVNQFFADDGTWKTFTKESVQQELGVDPPFDKIQTGTYLVVEKNQLVLNWDGVDRIYYKEGYTIPGNARANAIALTLNRMTDGSINDSLTEVWYKFNVTNGTEYWVWLDDKTLNAQIAAYYNSEVEALFEDEDGAQKSFTASQGGTVYVKVYPKNSGDTGSFGIAYSTSNIKPIIPATAIRLTEGRWTDGNIPTSGVREQWFSFTASASPQYIHIYFGTLTDLYVQLYDANGATVGSQTNLYSSTTNVNRPVTVGQVYYIKVTPYSNSYSGTYGITYNKSSARPATPPAVPGAPTVSAGPWINGITVSWTNLGALNGVTQYIVYRSTSENGAYTQIATVSTSITTFEPSYTDTTAAVGTTYYYKVSAKNSVGESDPSAARVGTRPIVSPLAEGAWTNGNIATSGGEEWFSFTATAVTQYIHVYFGSLTDLYIRLCDASGTTVGNASTNLYSGTTSTSRTLTSGQLYYIRVWPYWSTGSNASGTFGITFSAENTRPETPPAAPGGLSSSVAPWAEGIQVSWNNVSGADEYVVYRSTSSTGTYTEIGAADTNRYLDTTAAVGTTYYYRVASKNDAGEGAQSNPTSGAMLTTVILLTEGNWADGNIPTSSGEQWFSFSATAVTQYIHANFGTLNNMNVQLYNADGDTVGVQTRLWSTTTNINRQVTIGQVYYIRIQPYSTTYTGTYQIAFNTSSTNPPISLADTPPAPTGVNSEAGPWGGIKILWNSVDGAEEYVVYRSTAETGTYEELATVPYTTTAYLDTTAASAETTYYYKVAAKNNFGAGDQSSAINRAGKAILVTPLAEDAWTNGNIFSSGDEQWFSFTATAATQYIHVYFGTLNDLYVQLYDADAATVGVRTELRNTTTNINRPVTIGQMYYIRVTPYSSSYSGSFGITFNDSNTRPETPPTAPTNLSGSSAGPWAEGITLSWNAVTAATEYVVYRSADSTGPYTELNIVTTTSYIDTTAVAGTTYYYTVASKNSVGVGSQSSSASAMKLAATTLTSGGGWVDGNILLSSGEQWFSFSDAQNAYIQINFGTLTDLYVQYYFSNGNTLGAEVNINSSSTNKYTSQGVVYGTLYYVRVRPNGGSGDYQIALTTTSSGRPPTP